MLLHRSQFGFQRIILTLVLMLPFTAAYAITVPSIDVMFQTLANNMQPVMAMTGAIAYVMGFFFVVSALLDFKKIGESHGSGGSGIAGPLIKLFVAMALIYLPTTLETARWTLWNTGKGDSIFQYSPVSDATFDTVLKSSVLIIQAIGYIAIIRGFAMLSKVHSQGGQGGQASTGKAVVYIVAGILAVNIVATTRVVSASLGFVLG